MKSPRASSAASAREPRKVGLRLGYLWGRAREAGVSYRSYGEFVQNPPSTNRPVTTRLDTLKGHFDPEFCSFDLHYPDASRADRFISELYRFEREGDMPRLQIVRLPIDHTLGVSSGKRPRTAYVAEHDVALGRLVEAVSRSRFWTNTALFVIGDDAPKRTGPCGCPPDRSARDQPLYKARHGGFHALFNDQHAAHHRIDPWSTTHDAV